MERKLDFAYTNKEAIEWACRQNKWSRILLIAGDPEAYDLTWSAVDEMREKGWSNEKILRMCSENMPYNLNQSPRRPLPEIVVSGHPIVEEWDENEVRLALHKLAVDQIAKVKTNDFKNRVKPRGRYPDLYIRNNREEIEMLEGFTDRLTKEATPARGIRNR